MHHGNLQTIQMNTNTHTYNGTTKKHSKNNKQKNIKTLAGIVTQQMGGAA